MKQNDSKLHQLYLKIQKASDYFTDEDKKDMLKAVKEIYAEHEKIIKKNDKNGKYGIRYKTRGEDSSWSDTHEQFFSTKEKRDNVYIDWENDRTWDDIFDDELQYGTPGLNIHDIVKIFKENKKIYEEQKVNN